jgi:predicted tellurium resistance membrane protein TerC
MTFQKPAGLDFDMATIGDILQIVFADIILSGDNALVIGMAAAGLAPQPS